ncbi:MAG: DUF3892 domain-containing protein [bacterium]
MDKWADFGISHVRYDSSGMHITRVRIHKDLGDTFAPSQEMARSEVVLEIERGTTFVTITRSNGKWRKGEDVHIVKVRGVKYIRTDRNAKASDNLGDLPEF